MRARTPAPEVPSATNLPAGPQDDQASRMHKYLISMSIRTVCFVLAVVFTGWLRWVCVALAVVLPYIAVVIANATNQRRIDVLGAVRPDEARKQLGHK
ncbi:DUF3099 domain-containing protein [Calidifontibacter sp. DB0510]|uniref:DUF3099 domain-containing protein n=1 Tax=Metallococcus carri TaxID=1656884 RepID=A0A967AY47_9MICO|nr:DUF3099 domain-containing protein [Metallococcus carri]NHN54878.1 DUF3099 domain-containing protein [Metallococcus carri]NOP37223.1 DUF3099 domain-containing protein [Calidifontibacter sp. DB2511S]